MADYLKLSLVTPEKQVVNEEVEQVNVPGSEGDLGILYDHASLITNLRPGNLSYEKDNVTTELIVSQGYMEVTDNRVIILAESAEFLQEVDRERAEKAKSKAESILGKADLGEEEFQEAQDDLFRAIARLEYTESK
ncbi:MAG: F0F1 ATP synthase subunit epsilon [Nitrospinae bacterium]|nr:F0F1 ATP synthase subunit epsilon [Nitrospinota bacterium]MCH8311784.1 F0F1 ATP synthase subunit epsilon [Nitrospinota bacterium]